MYIFIVLFCKAPSCTFFFSLLFLCYYVRVGGTYTNMYYKTSSHNYIRLKSDLVNFPYL